MNIKRLIKGYEEWLDRHVDNEWNVYYLTFQFNHLSQNERVALDIMKREIGRFYATLVTNVVRNPLRATQRDNLPQLFAVPDRPVPKWKSNYSLADTIPNSGVHVHAFAAIPPMSRLKEDLVDHVDQNRARYLGTKGKLLRLDVRPVTTTPGRLVDYTFKSLKRRTFNIDNIVILPRSLTKLGT